MSLDVLRRKAPEMVRTELWIGLLADNFVRQSLLQAACAAECTPCQSSFCAAMQFAACTWLVATTTVSDSDGDGKMNCWRRLKSDKNRAGVGIAGDFIRELASRWPSGSGRV